MHPDRLATHIYAIQFEQVEFAERCGVILAPVPEQAEHREPIGIAGDGLTVDDARSPGQRRKWRGCRQKTLG